MTARLSPAWFIAAVAFTLTLLFAWFTNHAWEDYYITLRASLNLVAGHGLVFNPGEKLHTFTSPLGVLVPALCTWLSGGAGHEPAALWLFRFFNAAVLAVAAGLAWRRCASLGLGRFACVIGCGLIFADAKLVDFSINGMETAMLVFFVLLLWSELEAPGGPRPAWIAVACAGLMWTRPDAVVLGVALIVPHGLFRRRPAGATPFPWSPLLRGVLLGGLFYAPWFAWAWWYYGTPVPHTIIAKAAVTSTMPWPDFFLAPWHTLLGDSKLLDVFMPAYWIYGGWPRLLLHVAHGLAVVAAFAWVVPGLASAARRLSFAVFIGQFYVCAIILFPWYSPPWTTLAALTIALVVDQAIQRARAGTRPWLASTVRVAAGLALVVQAGTLLGVAWQMRVQQRVIEDGGRREIGDFLRVHARPGDTVFLEPLGYIGYFSGLKIYDYPGLSSPEVVQAMRNGAHRFTELIDRLHPTWLVLRPQEIADPRLPANAALRDYEVVRIWDARATLDAVRVLPGRAWLEHDVCFVVLRRKASVRG